MKDLIPTINIFISGIFGITVAIITWFLASRKDKRRMNIELELKEYHNIKNLYVSLISCIDRVIKNIRRMEDVEVILDELSKITAEIDIESPDSIKDKLGSVSNLISEWSFVYNKSLPKKFGDTGLSMISSEDFKYSDQANEIYPKLRKERLELIHLIKNELKQIKPST